MKGTVSKLKILSLKPLFSHDIYNVISHRKCHRSKPRIVEQSAFILVFGLFAYRLIAAPCAVVPHISFLALKAKEHFVYIRKSQT